MIQRFGLPTLPHKMVCEYFVSLISRTLHSVRPISLQLYHSTCIHLVVLEPGRNNHNIFFPIKIVYKIIITCTQPPQSVLHQSRPAFPLARPDARRRPVVGNLQSGRDRFSKGGQFFIYDDDNDRDYCACAPLGDDARYLICLHTCVKNKNIDL